MKVLDEEEAARADGADPHAILAGIGHGIVALGRDGRVAYANPAAARLWRCGPADLVGLPVHALIGGEADDPIGISLSEALRAGEANAFCFALPPSGTWMDARGYPCGDGYVLCCRDLGAERAGHRGGRAPGAADRAQRINQRVFETTLDLILVVDRQGTIIQVSPSVEQILGYRPSDMIGRNARDYLHPPDLDRTRNEMREARRGRLMRNFETSYVHKRGTVVPLAWTGIWSDSEQQHFFVGRDMTERNAAEERLRRAQRLEAVGQLTGGIAHDFNNLLTVVIGNLDLLQGRLGGDSKAAALVESALQASLRGATLTRQLLAFARRQALDVKVIDVNAQITGVLDILRRTLGEHIEIATSLGPGTWTAVADPTQLESALMNLAINARDAMPEGGRLLIETANRRIDEDYVAANLDATAGDYIMISVSDTGTGMSPETLAQAFEPFFTTKPAGQGTGLGLSMVYGFAKQSRGHVQIYSEVGQGTSVRLYLPRAGGVATVDAVAMPERAAPARPGERILAVEDNPDVRATVTQQLAALGYGVVAAENAEEAIKILMRGDAVDLLFSDVVMPGGMTGYELARAARALRPGLKVLLTSGFHAHLLSSREHGEIAEPLLIKPYRKVELAAKVRSVLDA